MRSGRALRTVVGALAVVVAAAAVASGQQESEYEIGEGDQLSISVWRHPELEREILVGSNGLVTFPPIGEVTAAGLTPSELSREIMQRLRDFTRETTQVTVTVTQYNSRAVFMTGQVVAPGRYSFDEVPDVLELLSQAGGPQPTADLSQVSIIRTGAEGPQIIRVDLGAYMRGTTAAPLPELRPGDMVEVPSTAGTGGAVAGQGLVYIFGEVGAPGAYPAPEGTDLLQLIAVAGGSTPDAQLDKVAVIMDGGDGQVVAKINLERIIEQGTPAPFHLAAGDRVFIPGGQANLARQILEGTATVFGYTGNLLSTYLLYLTIDEEVAQREAREAAE
jgi:polysaccharide export outer membrane protein